MSPQALDVVLSRAMRDAAFADLLFADPERALAGFDLTVEELTALKMMKREELESGAAVRQYPPRTYAPVPPTSVS